MSPDNDAAQPQDPASSEQQIQQQVALEQAAPIVGMMNPIAGMTPELIRQAQMASAGGGPGYEFDPAQVDNIIAKLEDVHDKAEDAGRRLLNAAHTIEAPAADPPSQRQAERTRASLYRAAEHNRRLQNYARSFIDNLRRAKQTYADTDASNATSMHQQM